MLDALPIGPLGGLPTADVRTELMAMPEQQPQQPHVTRKMQAQLKKLMGLAGKVNCADHFEEHERNALGERVSREYDIDLRSRSEWETKARRAEDIADQAAQEKNYPFEKASNIKYPMLVTAALQFAARAYPAIVDGDNIVKCKVVGPDPAGQKKARADRVARHMNRQIGVEMAEWEEDTDTMLHQVPVVGCAFRKTYYSHEQGRCRSEMISAFDFVVNQKTKDLDTVPRATHVVMLYPHEIEERRRSGVFLNEDLPQAEGEDDDAPHEFLEQMRLIDMDEDGYVEPWIVTVHKQTSKVMRIVANFEAADVLLHDDGNKIVRINRRVRVTKIPFIPDSSGGFYDVGFGKLLAPVSDVIDGTLNQIMDAGHLQNAGGGFVAAGLNAKSATLRMQPGKFHAITAPGKTIRESIVPHNFPGPSPVLFQVLGLMIDAGKDIAAIQDILTGDMPREQTATTTMAMIEQGLKVFTAIYKRIYRALCREFKILFELNGRYLDQPAYVMLQDQPAAVVSTDYDEKSMDVMPVADPKIVTDMQRIMMGQAVYELSMTNPMIDKFEATRRMLEALGCAGHRSASCEAARSAAWRSDADGRRQGQDPQGTRIGRQGRGRHSQGRSGNRRHQARFRRASLRGFRVG